MRNLLAALILILTTGDVMSRDGRDYARILRGTDVTTKLPSQHDAHNATSWDLVDRIGSGELTMDQAKELLVQKPQVGASISIEAAPFDPFDIDASRKLGLRR